MNETYFTEGLDINTIEKYKELAVNIWISIIFFYFRLTTRSSFITSTITNTSQGIPVIFLAVYISFLICGEWHMGWWWTNHLSLFTNWKRNLGGKDTADTYTPTAPSIMYVEGIVSGLSFSLILASQRCFIVRVQKHFLCQSHLHIAPDIEEGILDLKHALKPCCFLSALAACQDGCFNL